MLDSENIDWVPTLHMSLKSNREKKCKLFRINRKEFYQKFNEEKSETIDINLNKKDKAHTEFLSNEEFKATCNTKFINVVKKEFVDINNKEIRDVINEGVDTLNRKERDVTNNETLENTNVAVRNKTFEVINEETYENITETISKENHKQVTEEINNRDEILNVNVSCGKFKDFDGTKLCKACLDKTDPEISGKCGSYIVPNLKKPTERVSLAEMFEKCTSIKVSLILYYKVFLCFYAFAYLSGMINS